MKNLAHLNPYQLHTHLINEYILNQPGSTKKIQRDQSKDKRDYDVIRENHKFLWENEDQTDGSWEQQFAKRYYDKLFKEYTISDLQKYKENKIALRWRIEKEVVEGKGQFICGSKICSNKEDLKTWEVNFVYVEHGDRKNALVKLRLCPNCSEKLNYRTKKREIKRLKRKTKKGSKNTGESSSSSRKDDKESTVERSAGASTSSAETPVEEDDIEENEQKIEKISQQCWTKSNEMEDKSREEEFDEFLEDLLL